MLTKLRYGIGGLLVAGWPRESCHITRLSMYRRLADIGPELSLAGRVLSISHSENLCEIMKVRTTEIVRANYPEQSMLRLGFPDGSFDVVVSDQVLEHVEGSPQRAIDESFRVLRSGGVAVHTTCFINPIHEFPGDYWRFTAKGLDLLCKDHGDVIEAGQWGNRRAWFYVSLGLRGERVPRWRWHPLHKAAVANNPAWPIVTWVVVRKA